MEWLHFELNLIIKVNSIFSEIFVKLEQTNCCNLMWLMELWLFKMIGPVTGVLQLSEI